MLSTGLTVVGWVSGVLFVLIFSISLPIYTFSHSLTDPDLYLNALADQGLYAKSPQLFGQQMDFWVNTLKSKTFIAEFFFQNVRQSDWEIVAENIITPEWFKSQTESLVDQLFAYINGDQSTLKLNVTLTGVKERLGGQIGFDTYLQIVNSKPECNETELIQWLLSPVIDLLPICKLPENADFLIFSAPKPEEVVPKILADWANTLPDEKDLAASLGSADIQELDDFSTAIRLARTISGVFLLVSIIFLLLTFASPNGRTLKGWLRIWGIPLLVSGVILFLFAVLFSVLSIWQAGDFIGQLSDVFIPPIISLEKEIADQVILTLAEPLAIIGGVLVVIGFGMFSASVFLSARSSVKPNSGF